MIITPITELGADMIPIGQTAAMAELVVDHQGGKVVNDQLDAMQERTLRRFRRG